MRLGHAASLSRWSLALLATAALACNPARRCTGTSSTECGPDGVCLDGFCVLADAGPDPVDAGGSDGGPLDAGPTCATACPERLGCGVLVLCDGGQVDCGTCEACGAQRPNVCGQPPLCDRDGWCWENPRPQGNPLHDVFSPDGRRAWAVGARGTLLHFDGARWSLQTPNDLRRDGVRGVHGALAGKLVAVSDTGRVLVSSGADDWSVQQELGTPLHAVWMSADGGVTWLVGEAGKAYRRLDLGNGVTSLAEVPTGVTETLTHVVGLPHAPERVVVLGERSLLTLQSDGGFRRFDAGTPASPRGMWLDTDGGAWLSVLDGLETRLLLQTGLTPPTPIFASSQLAPTQPFGLALDDLHALAPDGALLRRLPSGDWARAGGDPRLAGARRVVTTPRGIAFVVGERGLLAELDLRAAPPAITFWSEGPAAPLTDLVGASPGALLAPTHDGGWLARDLNPWPSWAARECRPGRGPFTRATVDPRSGDVLVGQGTGVSRFNPLASPAVCTPVTLDVGFTVRGVTATNDGAWFAVGPRALRHLEADGGRELSSPTEPLTEALAFNRHTLWAITPKVNATEAFVYAWELSKNVDVRPFFTWRAKLFSLSGSQPTDGGEGTTLVTADQGYVFIAGPGYTNPRFVQLPGTDRDVVGGALSPDGRRGWAITDDGQVFSSEAPDTAWTARGAPADSLSQIWALWDAGVWVAGPEGTVLRHAP